MTDIRVGVVGVGNIGTMHANNIYFNRIKGMKLAAICDEKKSRLEFCRDRFQNISFYSDYNELFASGDIDAVVIAVPHRLHAKIAKEALQANLHVLVEKPIDITVTEGYSLIEVAKKSDKVFGIMLNQRTNTLFQKAREIVQGGFLGDLKRTVWIVTNWYRTQHYYDSGNWRATWSGEGGGVLLNQAPHNLDLWQWICGMPKTVRAFCNVAKYHNIQVEDEATIYTKYANGATGVFITTTGEYPGTNRLEISGDRGKLVLEHGILKWWKLSESERSFCFSSSESFPHISCEYETISDTEQETGHIGILQNFADAIIRGDKLIAPGEDGICELLLSNAAYLSEWTGNSEISIPFDMQQFDRLLEEHKKNSFYKETDVVESDDSHQARWKVRW